MFIFKSEIDVASEKYIIKQLDGLKEKMELVRRLAKGLKHGEDCFKSHGYKDEMECRCSLPELRKLLEK